MIRKGDVMSIGEQFQILADEWVHHCRRVMLSSNMRDYLDHPAYRSLVSLGQPVVPFIMDRLPDDEGTPWEFVLEEITGNHFLENPRHFNPAEVKRRWLAWW